MRFSHSAYLLLQVVFLSAAQQPEISTDAGSFRGRHLTSLNGREFAAFSGIPYVQPPVGSLRFKEPEPLSALEGIYDATVEKDDCLQLHSSYNKYPPEENKEKIFVGNEDCLYLNIYSPNVKPEKPLPVMIMIHGGANLKGSGSSELHGPELLMDRDVVFVTLNYRLGLFGFMSLDDEVAPGNLGLKDQSAALHWVKKNIANFGGDSDKITVFGESAGGASTQLHMISPRSRGTFIRAISQSGTAECVWAIQNTKKGRENAKVLAESVGCLGSAVEVLECLRAKPVEELLVAAKKLAVYGSEAIFNTVVENEHDKAFLTKQSLETESTMPWMAGVNSAEGLVVYGGFARSGDADLKLFNKTYTSILPRMLRYSESPNKENITKRIKEYYIQDKSFSRENVGDFIDLFSHSMFFHGQVKGARKHAGPLYQYYFAHKGQRPFNPTLPDDVAKYGADHAEELLYLLNYKKVYPNIVFNEEDKKVSNLLLDLWTNFATYGDPTPNEEVKWPESNKGKLSAEITKNGIQIKENLLDSTVIFWDELEKIKSRKDEL